MHNLEIYVFGVQRVIFDGEIMSFPYRKAEALFFLIAVDKRISRSHAIELLWAEKENTTARKDLRNAIYVLNKHFKFPVISTEQKDILQLSEECNIKNEYDEFVEKGNLDVYEDTFLRDFYVKDAQEFEIWLTEQQEFLQKIYLAKMNQRLLESSGHDIYEMEILAEKYLRQNPLDEEIYYRLMKEYEENGMYYKGIQTYQKLSKMMNEELGISPSKETVKLYRKLSDRWLSEASNDETETKDSGFVQEYQANELQKLHYLYTMFVDEMAVNALITGPENVGKEYLLEQFLKDTQEENRLVLKTNCLFTEKNFPLQPWSVLITQLSNYIKENQIHLPNSYTDAVDILFPVFGSNTGTFLELSMDLMESRSFHAFQSGLCSILQQIACNTIVVIAITNIQNMDKVSFYLLSVLIRISIPNIFLVLSCTDLAGLEQKDVLQEFVWQGMLSEVHVNPLTLEQVERYVADIEKERGCAFNDSFKKELYRYSGGGFRAVKELILQYEKNGADFEILFSDEMMEKKWQKFSGSEKHILNLLSILEIGMSIDMLSSVYGEEFVNSFDALCRLKNKHIIKEVVYNEHVYFQFENSYFKDFVYKRMKEEKKKVYHNRIGMALEDLVVNQIDGNRYKRMIYHFQCAGNDWKVLYYQLKSLENIIVQMYDVYPVYIRSIDSLVKPDNPIIQEFDRIEKLLGTGRFDRAGIFTEMWARFDYSKACYCISRGEYEEGKSRIMRGLSNNWVTENSQYELNFHRLMAYYGIQTQNLAELKKHTVTGLDISDKGEYIFEKNVFLRIKGLYQMMIGDYEESIKILNEALNGMEHCAVNRQTKAINLAATYNYLGEAWRRQKMFEKAKPNYIRALQICSENGCPQNATFYMNLATVYLGLGEEDEAFKMLCQADALYDSSLLLKGRVITKSYLAVFYAKMGEMEKASEYLRDAYKFTELLKSPGENGIFYRILSKLKERYYRQFAVSFPGTPQEYEEKGTKLLEQVEGFYEIDNLYISWEPASK